MHTQLSSLLGGSMALILFGENATHTLHTIWLADLLASLHSRLTSGKIRTSC